MKTPPLLSGLSAAVVVLFLLTAGCADTEDDETETSAGAIRGDVDDACRAAYSEAAGRCNANARDDDAALTECLEPVKRQLLACCDDGGSAQCARDATSAGDAQKTVDDHCRAAYSQAAGSCNTSAGDDDAAFSACLSPVKKELIACCNDGGSPSCAVDAQ
jgi:hypothetical protein